MADIATMWSSLHTQLQAHRPGVVDAGSAEQERVTRVCVLSGFLGSGKSTLLAQLLTNGPDGMVIKAIVNDVGALRFDPTLVASRDAMQVELTNGCGCCEQTAGLAAALDVLSADATTDLILLEASGIADPFALAQVIAANPRLHVDRTISVIDASTISAHLANPTLAVIIRRQIEAAHGIVVSHCDRLSHAEARRVIAEVSRLAPGRVVLPSSLDAPAFDVLLPAAPRGARPWPSALDGVVQAEMVAITVRQLADVDESELRSALAQSRPGLVRAKGRVKIGAEPMLVQMTPSTLSVSSERPTTNDVPPCECGITLIGTDLASTEVVAQLLRGARRSSADL